MLDKVLLDRGLLIKEKLNSVLFSFEGIEYN